MFSVALGEKSLRKADLSFESRKLVLQTGDMEFEGKKKKSRHVSGREDLTKDVEILTLWNDNYGKRMTFP